MKALKRGIIINRAARQLGLGNERDHPNNESVRDLLAKELLCVCKAALELYGVDARRFGQLASGICGRSARTPVSERLFQDLNLLSELAAEWAESSAYLDTSGRPRVIPIAGRGATFASLTQKYFGTRRCDEILNLACRTRVAERVGAKNVAQVNAGVMLTGKPLLLLARAILSVRWLLATAENNGRKHRGAGGLWPERLACGFVSDKQFLKFAGLMRPQIANLANMSHRWLTRHGTTGALASRRKLAGIHAYIFRD